MTGRTKKDEASRWFSQSYYDLKAAEWNFRGGFYNTACFLAQQSAEKGLKATGYLLNRSRRKMWTHSVYELIGILSKDVPDLHDELGNARELDLHYIPARYPNGIPGGFPFQFYDQSTAQNALKASERILRIVGGFFNNIFIHLDE